MTPNPEDVQDPAVVFARERKKQRNRVLAITVFCVTAVFYCAFVINKFIVLTTPIAEEAETTEIETVNANSGFFSDESKMSDDAYETAADREDVRILEMLRKKQQHESVNLKSPRSNWYERVKELNEIKDKIDEPPHSSADSEREMRQLRNIKGDRPEV